MDRYSYSEDPKWDDVIPIPQEDGDRALAQIAYDEDYAEGMSYFRAIMARGELSERALEITERIIELNPAHYTVWLYRAKILFSLQRDLREELEFVNKKALAHEKNYQIWHHRQSIVDALNDCTGESDFITKMFEKDSKNYHVWSYRQWLVRRFDLWETGEIEYLDGLLEADIRNNSAWNHRFFVIFGRDVPPSTGAIGREIRMVEEFISRAPQNPSPWNYLRGLLTRTKLPLSTVEGLCRRYASIQVPDGVKSSHALELLLDICIDRVDGKKEAELALNLLADRYDPIRKNYWLHRKSHPTNAFAMRSA